jgi:hypothetical protein
VWPGSSSRGLICIHGLMESQWSSLLGSAIASIFTDVILATVRTGMGSHFRSLLLLSPERAVVTGS